MCQVMGYSPEPVAKVKLREGLSWTHSGRTTVSAYPDVDRDVQT